MPMERCSLDRMAFSSEGSAELTNRMAQVLSLLARLLWAAM